MTREEKATIIDELSRKFDENAHFYITDATGLTVAQVNDFRRACFKGGVEYRVYKNTLIRKALERRKDSDYTELFKVLNGFSGIIFSKEKANAPAQVLKEIRAKIPTGLVLKAASVEEDVYIGDNHLEGLSQLKSREELIGDIILLLQSPAKNLISALTSGRSKVAGLVKALEKRATT